MSKDKKKFRDTTVGKFLTENAPDVLATISDTVDDYFPPVKIITTLLKGTALPPEKQAELEKALLTYEETERKDFLADTADARQRQVEFLKAGGNDHLMYVAGYTALAAFGVMIYAVIWKPEAIKDSALFHQLMGIIEGVALTIFTFYFGSSKGSADKTKMLKG